VKHLGQKRKPRNIEELNINMQTFGPLADPVQIVRESKLKALHS